MIGGQRITDVTRAQARELLDAASEEFQVPLPDAQLKAKPAKNGRGKVKAGR
jgi:hypothetical protein